MPYSVMLPRNNSAKWRIIDDGGNFVFAGQYRECEECLDQADMSPVVGGSPLDGPDNSVLFSTKTNGMVASSVAADMIAFIDKNPKIKVFSG